jgi:hypothetical protein
MVNHICEICNYSTKNTTDLVRHKKSKKHILNIEKHSSFNKSVKIENSQENGHENGQSVVINQNKKSIYSCNICEKNFTDKSNMYRHRRKHKEYKKNNKQNENDINLKKQNEELKKQNEELLKLANKNAETANLATKTNNKTIHIMSHATKNFSEAPVIQQLEHTKSKNLLVNHAEDSTHSIEDLMIFNYENKILHEYLGDMLIKYYKNEEPCKQSLWASDTSRMNFILKQYVGDGSEWVNDKKGIKLKKLVIVPILDKVKKMLSKKIIKLTKEMQFSDEEESEVPENMYKILYCKEIISLICKKKLHTEIVKYMCPHMNFQKSDNVLKKKSKRKHKE